jgi:CheY-like chemotaxis protein
MRPRDHFTITVLQDLFEGVGFNGTLVDLSMGGCNCLIQRAIRIQDERRLPITTELLDPGATLALVRLGNLPNIPSVECGAHLCFLNQRPEGVTAGLRFEGLGTHETGILAQFLQERIPGLEIGFPNRRRLRDLLADDLRPAGSPDLQDPPVQDEVGGIGTPAQGEEECQVQGASSDSELLEDFMDKDPLFRVRKRGKKVLLVMTDDLELTTFMATLHQDGYRCLFEAKSLVRALELVRRLPMDLLVLDQTVGHLGALKMVEVLRASGLPQEVPVVVMQKSFDHQLNLAVVKGQVNLLVERPVNFPGVVKQVLEGLLGL